MKCSEAAIYRAAIKTWGLPNQLNILTEESAEVIQATIKILRLPTPQQPLSQRIENLAEEIADVQLCQEQIIDYFKIQDKIDFYREKKLQRLKQLLEAKL